MQVGNKKTIFAAVMPLYLVIFFGFAGYSLMITIFTPLLLLPGSGILPSSLSLSSRTILLGILLSLYPAGQFFGSPVLGALSDRLGRKRILIISLILTALFYTIIVIGIQINYLSFLMLGSLFAGLCEANIVIAQSAIADLVPEVKRNQYFGYIYMSASAAYIVAPLLGGKLADSSILPWFSSDTPFISVLILMLFTAAYTQIHFTDKQEKLTVNSGYFSEIINLKNVFLNKSLRFLFGVNFLFYLAIYGFFRCYPMYLVNEFHLNISQVSEFIAWVAVPIVIANTILTGFLSKRFKSRQLAAYSAIFTGIFMVSIVVFHPMTSLWLTLFLTALGLAVCLPSCATMLSVLVSNQQQGQVMGSNQSLQVAAEALSGIIGGLMASIMIKLPLVVLGLVAIFAAILLLRKNKSI